MRSIKFRAWKDGIKYNVRTLAWHHENIVNILIYDGTLEGKWLCSWDALEQFTGLYDENGKEIYEGDVIEAYDTKLRVTFQGVVKFGDASFYIESTTGTKHFRWIDYIAIIVIGNIHENPELVEALA